MYPVAADHEILTQPLEAAARLRFTGCRVEHSRGGLSRAVVDFVGATAGGEVSGVQVGPTSADGDLRLVAQATLDAIIQFSRGAVRLELMGVKLIRAFDTTLVVVAVFAVDTGATTRMVGAALSDIDAPTAAAKATLHAVNRMVAPFLTGPAL